MGKWINSYCLLVKIGSIYPYFLGKWINFSHFLVFLVTIRTITLLDYYDKYKHDNLMIAIVNIRPILRGNRPLIVPEWSRLARILCCVCILTKYSHNLAVQPWCKKELMLIRHCIYQSPIMTEKRFRTVALNLYHFAGPQKLNVIN